MKQHDNRLSVELASTPLPIQGLASGATPATSATSATPSSISAIQTASGIPVMSGTSPCSGAAVSAGIDAADTSSTSLQPQIHAEVRNVINGIGCNAHVGGRLLDAWDAYSTFAAEHGTLPARLEGIDPVELTRFVVHARSVQEDINALLMTLTMLGTLLMHAGHHPRVLAALTAAVRRIRVQNARNGKYAYGSEFVPPASGPHVDSGSEV